MLADFRRFAVARKTPQIPAARYNIGRMRHFHEFRYQLRLVLAVAVDSHKHVVTAADCILESRAKGGAIPQITLVGNQLDVIPSSQQLRSAVGRAVIDD